MTVCLQMFNLSSKYCSFDLGNELLVSTLKGQYIDRYHVQLGRPTAKIGIRHNIANTIEIGIRTYI